MSLEFEYLHQKGRCEMLIGGDDIIVKMSLPLVHMKSKSSSSLNIHYSKYSTLFRCTKKKKENSFLNLAWYIGTCFSMFVYIRVCFYFALIGGNLTAQSMGSHRETGGRIQIPET